MIQSRKNDIMANQYVISNIDASLVLKPTARINENVASQMNILSKICCERREKPEIIADLASNQL